jgi:predicted class III extradiol MEMO1 family dioxygenase
MSLGRVRRAAKAGEWYFGDPAELAAKLQEYLDDVPDQINGSNLPIPGARIVISP